jgi:hypothetical protein
MKKILTIMFLATMMIVGCTQESPIEGKYENSNGTVVLEIVKKDSKLIGSIGTSGLEQNTCAGGFISDLIKTKTGWELTKEENGDKCVVSILVNKNTLSVSEDNCSMYHGMMCDFNDELTKTKK